MSHLFKMHFYMHTNKSIVIGKKSGDDIYSN